MTSTLEAPTSIAAPTREAAARQLGEDGWCVIPGVLSPAQAAHALDRLWAAAEEYRRRGNSTAMIGLDPSAANVRVFDLIDIDPLFRDLIRHPLALELVRGLLGPDILISNFTANIARPGSGSMSIHSDQALVVPEPWFEPWSINIIWALTDTTFENGSTLFIPGSHRASRMAEVGPDPAGRLQAFEAKAGSIIAMDGRVWHTSGRNVTADQDRALLFGYYCRAFLRPQANWPLILSPQTQDTLDSEFRQLLGLTPTANITLAGRVLGANIGQRFG